MYIFNDWLVSTEIFEWLAFVTLRYLIYPNKKKSRLKPMHKNN